MNKAEQILNKAKANLDQLQAPPELESRLRSSLSSLTVKSSRNNRLFVRAIATSLVLLLVISFNLETLAYYGKKLVGYDQVMNGTLQQLNDLGKGQHIGKSYRFKNGTVVTLDGVMVDDTQLLAFLTVTEPEKGSDEDHLNLSNLYLKGFHRQYRAESGQGFISEGEEKEIRWQYSFEPPRFYEQKLLFKFTLEQNGIAEEGEIAFNLDRNKAVGQTLQINLNESFNAHQEQIKLTSLLASPTQTVLKGLIQDPFALAKDHLTGERIRPLNLEIKLVANGEEIAELGGGMQTNLNGISFHKNYDALPQDLKSLQIIIESFSADHDVQEKVTLGKGKTLESVQVKGQEIWFDKVEELGDNTQVTVTSCQGVVLSKVKLIADGKPVSLAKTIDSSFEKTAEGKVYHTRTMVFPAQGTDLELKIEGLTYPEKVNQLIEVPVR